MNLPSWGQVANFGKNLGIGVLNNVVGLANYVKDNPLQAAGALGIGICLAAFAPAAGAVLVTGAMAVGAYTAVKGAMDAHNAYSRGDQAAGDKAVQQIGSGLTDVVFSGVTMATGTSFLNAAKTLGTVAKTDDILKAGKAAFDAANKASDVVNISNAHKALVWLGAADDAVIGMTTLAKTGAVNQMASVGLKAATQIGHAVTANIGGYRHDGIYLGPITNTVSQVLTPSAVQTPESEKHQVPKVSPRPTPLQPQPIAKPTQTPVPLVRPNIVEVPPLPSVLPTPTTLQAKENTNPVRRLTPDPALAEPSATPIRLETKATIQSRPAIKSNISSPATPYAVPDRTNSRTPERPALTVSSGRAEFEKLRREEMMLARAADKPAPAKPAPTKPSPVPKPVRGRSLAI